VDQHLLRRNEYLVAENTILRNQITGRLRLTDGERTTLPELGQRLGKKVLADIATVVKPETILAWHRTLIARKFDGSKRRRSPGRPRIDHELEGLIVRMAQETRRWGYDRIVGALAKLGYRVSDKTVGQVLKRNGLTPAPERAETTTWKEFIDRHKEVLVATDFFTTEVWTTFGLVTYYILFFIRIQTREVSVAGFTAHPNQPWMTQITRNVTMVDDGFLREKDVLIHDRDGKFSMAFQNILQSGGVRLVRLPPQSPNLNAFAERWVRSIKGECLSKIILFGERSLYRALQEYRAHYHHERNHQGKHDQLLVPSADSTQGWAVC
jgi:transposase